MMSDPLGAAAFVFSVGLDVGCVVCVILAISLISNRSKPDTTLSAAEPDECVACADADEVGADAPDPDQEPLIFGKHHFIQFSPTGTPYRDEPWCVCRADLKECLSVATKEQAVELMAFLDSTVSH